MVSGESFRDPLHAAAGQARTYLDWKNVKVRNVDTTAAAVLAPCRRPFTVGKHAGLYGD